MAYFSTEPASERRNPTGKNRVRDFFRLSNETHPAKRRQPAQPRRKSGPTATKPASGIPYWPSRDPIGEEGGLNLYGFIGNDGVGGLDLLGRLITNFTKEVSGTSRTIKFVVPIVFIIKENCKRELKDKKWLTPEKQIKIMSKYARIAWTGTFGRYLVNFDYDFKTLTEKDREEAGILGAEDHASARNYNLIVIDCCCRDSNEYSSWTDNGGNWDNNRLPRMNVTHLCVNDSKNINASFTHELGHILGHQEAYYNVTIGGKPTQVNNPAFENMMMSIEGGSVTETNWSTIMGNKPGGVGSYFVDGEWETRKSLAPSEDDIRSQIHHMEGLQEDYRKKNGSETKFDASYGVYVRPEDIK